MKKTLILLPIVVMMACGQGESADQQGENGQDSTAVLSQLLVEITEEGMGELPKEGDQVSVHYVGTLLATGDTFDSSYDYGAPFKFPLGQGRVIPGWDQGIAQLRKGCKARLTVPAHLAYGDREIPTIPPHSDLVFDLEVIDIEPAAKPWPTEGMEVKETQSGLRYVLIEKGKGPKLEAGKTVRVHYSGFLEGSLSKFDSSVDRGEPIEFPLGTGQVIPGWDEGLSLLSVGSKAQLIIPAHLAYGDQGAGGVIPPGATLIFDVEVVGMN